MRLTTEEVKSIKSHEWEGGLDVAVIIIENLIDTIEALQQENEQLKAQDVNEQYFCQTGTPKDSSKYHNPADVEALKQAKETLNALNIRGGLGYEKHKWIDRAINDIDRALEKKKEICGVTSLKCSHCMPGGCENRRANGG